jgi:predicted RNase H-like HicB family nuclease
MVYTIVLDYDPEERVYNVSVPALPGCFTWGKTRAQAVKHAKQAIEAFLAALIDLGEEIPEEVDLERVRIQ